MEWNTSKVRGGARVVAVLGLTSGLFTASGAAVMATSSAQASQPGLAGTWTVQVTRRDCATNDPLGPPFNSLETFHRGGTQSGSTASLAFAIGQRTAEHGTWARQRGRTYLQQMVALILFDTEPNLPGIPGFDPTAPVSPGFFAGWQTVSHTVRLTDGNNFTSSGTNAFYKNDGEQYRTGCSTAIGERFE